MVASNRRDRIQADATRLLEAGVSGQVFPGAAAAVSWREHGETQVAVSCAGRLTPGGGRTGPDTPYDLASITKPFVATSALRLVASSQLALDVRAESYISDIRGTIGGQATLEELLSHRSGLAAWGGLYLDVPHERGTPAARRWIISEAARRPAEEDRGKVIYSDLGYMLAGELISKIAGCTLDQVVAEQVTEPLGIAGEVYYAGVASPERKGTLIRTAAPTEMCDWRGRVARGEVHDENCAALAGVSGHAGLFGTARGVAIFGRALLDSLQKRLDFLPSDLIAKALTRPVGSTSTYRLGWDSKGDDARTGKRLSPHSFGHFGFTGTSLWCDPARDVVLVLLTNRVHKSRANEKIKGFRPAFHDGILAVLES